MTIVVSDPTDGGTANVDTNDDNSINVAGSADQSGVGPSKVCVKIYPAGTPIGNIPTSPPTGAVCQDTNQSPDFSIAGVKGADCSASPGTENLLVVWALFGSTYERKVTSFYGICV